MATVQLTWLHAVFGAKSRRAWQLKSALRHNVSAVLCTIIFLHIFASIAGELLLYVQQWLVMI